MFRMCFFQYQLGHNSHPRPEPESSNALLAHSEVLLLRHPPTPPSWEWQSTSVFGMIAHSFGLNILQDWGLKNKLHVSWKTGDQARPVSTLKHFTEMDEKKHWKLPQGRYIAGGHCQELNRLWLTCICFLLSLWLSFSSAILPQVTPQEAGGSECTWHLLLPGSTASSNLQAATKRWLIPVKVSLWHPTFLTETQSKCPLQNVAMLQPIPASQKELRLRAYVSEASVKYDPQRSMNIIHYRNL